MAIHVLSCADDKWEAESHLCTSFFLSFFFLSLNLLLVLLAKVERRLDGTSEGTEGEALIGKADLSEADLCQLPKDSALGLSPNLQITFYSLLTKLTSPKDPETIARWCCGYSWSRGTTSASGLPYAHQQPSPPTTHTHVEYIELIPLHSSNLTRHFGGEVEYK